MLVLESSVAVWHAGTRLMFLLYCRWRSRRLNQRTPSTQHLHLVVNLGRGTLVIVLAHTAVIVVLQVAHMVLCIGHLEDLVLELADMVVMQVLVVNMTVDMVVSHEA